MKNENNNSTEEELKNEPPVRGIQLLEQMLPLLRDCFVGELSRQGHGILYKLPNGQIFMLKITQLR